MNLKGKYKVGIDIGGTNSVLGVVDVSGNILAESSIKTALHNDINLFIQDLDDELEKMLEGVTAISNIQGIGIGAPNGNFYTGNIEFAPNLPWKGVIPLAKLIENKTGIKTVLTNDANAAAIGEMIYGNAQGEKDFIMITLGTGVGSGIVANGQLIYGHDGFAGEIGHTIYDPNGRECGCGRKGCLETYASAGGIVATAKELLAKNSNKSVLREISLEDLSAKNIAFAAENGDETAIEVYDLTAKILGIKLADSIAHTSPATIYIFGGVANAGDILLKPLEKYMNQYVLEIYRNKVQLKLSGLTQGKAAILGAAALVSTV